MNLGSYINHSFSIELNDSEPGILDIFSTLFFFLKFPIFECFFFFIFPLKKIR